MVKETEQKNVESETGWPHVRIYLSELANEIKDPNPYLADH